MHKNKIKILFCQSWIFCIFCIFLHIFSYFGPHLSHCHHSAAAKLPLKIDFSSLNIIFFCLSLNFGSLLLLQKWSFWKSKPRSLTARTRRTNFSGQNFDNYQIAGRVAKSNFSHSIIVEYRWSPLYGKFVHGKVMLGCIFFVGYNSSRRNLDFTAKADHWFLSFFILWYEVFW